jgi:hypothetical protein
MSPSQPRVEELMIPTTSSKALLPLELLSPGLRKSTLMLAPYQTITDKSMLIHWPVMLQEENPLHSNHRRCGTAALSRSLFTLKSIVEPLDNQEPLAQSMLIMFWSPQFKSLKVTPQTDTGILPMFLRLEL